MNGVYRDMKALLEKGGMEMGEARAVALLLMEKVCGCSVEQVLMDNGKGMKDNGQEDIVMEMARRVAAGEPVQYVLGEAEFCGMNLVVRPGVLIPRTETEELVEWVCEELGMRSGKSGARILDIGTGSGCIAVALAKRMKEAQVEAWDVSEEALQVAQENAERQGVNIHFQQVDVLAFNGNLNLNPNLNANHNLNGNLNHQLSTVNYFDVLVSNPPYICEEEAEEMERNVLEHEPGLALFVPNDDPLLFYREIAQMGKEMLKDEGMLFFEINRRFGHEVVEMLREMGYREVELRRDVFGNDRMVKAIKG